MIENRMVVDSEWEFLEKTYVVLPEIEESKYVNISTGEEVLIEDALEYAREHEEQQADETDDEFVEWFFSGNWVKK